MIKNNIYECFMCETECTSFKKLKDHFKDKHNATFFKQDGKLKMFIRKEELDEDDR